MRRCNIQDGDCTDAPRGAPLHLLQMPKLRGHSPWTLIMMTHTMPLTQGASSFVRGTHARLPLARRDALSLVPSTIRRPFTKPHGTLSSHGFGFVTHYFKSLLLSTPIPCHRIPYSRLLPCICFLLYIPPLQLKSMTTPLYFYLSYNLHVSPAVLFTKFNACYDFNLLWCLRVPGVVCEQSAWRPPTTGTDGHGQAPHEPNTPDKQTTI